MANEVKSALEATEIAVAFLKKHRFFVSPLSAIRENGNWMVKIDVGPLARVTASIKIDAKTGEILEYNIP